jgi:[ribosomal protein S5]-alanine N-acetyltransferase
MSDSLSITKHLPIQSHRISIDRFVPEDCKSFYEIEQSPEQHRFNRETYNPRTEEEISEFIHKMNEQKYDERRLPMLFAVRKEDKSLIGFIGFKNGKLQKSGSIEVYYSINKKYWNNGYGTEALKRLITFGFEILGLHRIFSGCDIENVASKRVMEKAGMRYESRWRQDRIREGKWTDGLGFAILDEDVAEQ